MSRLQEENENLSVAAQWCRDVVSGNTQSGSNGTGIMSAEQHCKDVCVFRVERVFVSFGAFLLESIQDSIFSGRCFADQLALRSSLEGRDMSGKLGIPLKVLASFGQTLSWCEKS